MNTERLRKAGRLGGIARIAKYGNPGTTAGRKKGGLRSLATHRARGTAFKTLQKIIAPQPSVELAELLGIFMGDGHVGVYQATIVTNSETDYQHATYVQSLIQKVFEISARLKTLKSTRACVVVISSKEVCTFLRQQGLSTNKVVIGVNIPSWLERKKAYSRAFVRGVFDTDGCVFLDTHIIKSRVYKNLGIAFTNRTLPLLTYFRSHLEAEGLHPTQKTKFTVFLRREREIRRYFELIGTSNSKHRDRYSEFNRIRQGGVA